jgi:hypothetical protein
VVVTDLSVGCRINDPTRYLRRTRTVENKHEDEGGVNWKLLPAGIGNHVCQRGDWVCQPATSEQLLCSGAPQSLGWMDILEEKWLSCQRITHDSRVPASQPSAY